MSDIIGKSIYGKRDLVRGRKKIIQHVVGARDRTFRERVLNVALYKRKASTRAETRGLLISTLAARALRQRNAHVCAVWLYRDIFFFVFLILLDEKDGAMRHVRRVRAKSPTSQATTQAKLSSRVTVSSRSNVKFVSVEQFGSSLNIS